MESRHQQGMYSLQSDAESERLTKTPKALSAQTNDFPQWTHFSTIGLAFLRSMSFQNQARGFSSSPQNALQTQQVQLCTDTGNSGGPSKISLMCFGGGDNFFLSPTWAVFTWDWGRESEPSFQPQVYPRSNMTRSIKLKGPTRIAQVTLWKTGNGTNEGCQRIISLTFKIQASSINHLINLFGTLNSTEYVTEKVRVRVPNASICGFQINSPKMEMEKWRPCKRRTVLCGWRMQRCMYSGQHSSFQKQTLFLSVTEVMALFLLFFASFVRKKNNPAPNNSFVLFVLPSVLSNTNLRYSSF